MSINAEVFTRFTKEVGDWKKQEIENKLSTMSAYQICTCITLTTNHYTTLQVLHNDFIGYYTLLVDKQTKCDDELCFFIRYHIYIEIM